MKTHIFHVSGLHCASCKILIEDILSKQSFVKNVQVNIKKETVEIETKNEQNSLELAQTLTSKIKSNGYTLSIEKSAKEKQSDDVIWKALPIGLVFLIFFFTLQKSGILNLGIGGQITPVTSFIIGLIASVSSCLAIVGGLVLSLSAKVSQDNVSDTKTFLLFHVGRLFSFAILGGVLGAVGSAIGISFIFTAILGLVASMVMLLLGLNLVGVFAKNKIALPSGIFNFFKKIEHKTLTPIIISRYCNVFFALWFYTINASFCIGKWIIFIWTFFDACFRSWNIANVNTPFVWFSIFCTRKTRSFVF